MSDKLDTLKRLAQQATPGPWKPCIGSGHSQCTALHSDFNGNTFIADFLPDYALKSAPKSHLPTMKFVRALHPGTTLKLLDVAEAAAWLIEAQTAREGDGGTMGDAILRWHTDAWESLEAKLAALEEDEDA